MNRKLTSWIGWMTLALAGLLVLGMLVLRQWAQPPTTPATAAAQVKQAWTNVSLMSNYTFSADMTIKTIPVATAGNIGRFSQTDTLYLEGSNDLPNKSVQMALWGGGVSVADRSNAYQVRVMDGVNQTREGDGEWQSGQSGAVAFAPEGDFLAFVEMAKNVAFANERRPSPGDPACAAVDCSQLTVYTFDLDPAAYAERMRAMSQAQMIRVGQLPPGATVQIPEHLANVTGSGELWVDGRGLPVREKVSIAIPPAPGADNRSETVMDIRFTHYQGGMLAATNGWERLEARIASVSLPRPSDLSMSLGIFFLALLAMFKLVRPSRRTHIVATVTVLAAMNLSPLLQVHAMGLANGRIAVQRESQAAAQEGQSFQQTLRDIRTSLRTAAPYSPPAAVVESLKAVENASALAVSPQVASFSALSALQSAPSADVDPSLDSDGDGLTDVQEALIGTSSYAKDSDLDGISDYVEVTGFSYNGKTWYGNPLWADSNNDGRLDGEEWNLTVLDRDDDGTPDLYDYDDDGDGVPDDLDISPLVASKDNGGNLVTFSASNPMTLTVNGLQPNRYTFIDLQLRPSNPAQLWYAFNVLNWPKDEKGNMQDWDGKTLFDACIRDGGSNCQMNPDANGDIKLVPTLEVRIDDLSNLPRTASGELDTGLLTNYNISVQATGNGGYAMYVPLTLVEDTVTTDKVAFSAQMVYQTGATWKPQQVRLVWTIQALNEQYNSPEQADTAIKAGNGYGANHQTVLHAYYTDFYLTGLNVREDRGAEMAMVYEDPATDNDLTSDDALLHMTNGLDNSFLINRDCNFVDNAGNCVGDGQRDITIPVIAQRWDSATSSGFTEDQRWGIPTNRLRVETHSFASQDEATMIGGGQYASAILSDRFTAAAATSASMLFVRESRFRSSNIDARVANASRVNWTGHRVQVTLSGVAEMVTAGYVKANYKYVNATNSWQRQTPQEKVQEIEQRYPVQDDTGSVARNSLVTVTQGEQAALILMETNAIQGNQTVTSNNGTSGFGANFGQGTQGLRFQAADFSDSSLRITYAQALAAGSNTAPYVAAGTMLELTSLSKADWEKAIKAYIYQAGSGGLRGDLGGLSTRAGNLENALRNKFIQAGSDNISIAKVRATASIAALFAFAGGIIATNIKGGETVGQIMLATTTAVSSTINAIATFKTVANNISSVVSSGVSTTANVLALSIRFSINSAAGKAAIIGAVIGTVATWAFFFAAWGKGGLSTDSVEFNNLVAGAIAATILIVINLILSLSVVGLIVQAVFAVLDLIALIVCKSGVSEACDLGITKAMTKTITDWLYTGAVMIDTGANPALTNIKDAKMQLTNPDQGLIAGNGVRFEVNILSVARHAYPEPGIIYHFPNFFTREDLQSTTLNYALENDKRNLPANLNQTTWDSVRGYNRATASVPSPVLGWLLPLDRSKNLYEGRRTDTLTSGVYPFTSAQINQSFPLYLNTGMALPRYDCWFQVCVHKSAKSASSTDLGEQFVLDILPATLDEFVNWTQLGDQVDLDGDGLGSRSGSTIDPDPTKADTDSDGVPDDEELWAGSNPRVADSDSDGLSDALERRFQTNPLRSDSDGDGISDFDEVNGYNLTLGGMTVFVVSNPNRRDTDGDGISDGAERRLNGIDAARYPFSPQVFNDAPVRIYTVLDDLDRVLAVGATTTVTTTVYNGTAVENSLMAGGQFSAALPIQLGSATQTKSFSLLPTANTSIVLNGTAASANGVFSITTGVAADLVLVGDPSPAAPFTDIVLDDPVPVTIDNDAPNVPALTLGSYVQPGRTVIIGGTASDPTSYVAQVDVSVDGGAFGLATGTGLWAYSVDIPNTPTGTIPVSVRASDAVNNTSLADFSLAIDGVSPDLTVGLNPGDIRQVRRNAAGDWTLALSGTTSDALAGIDSLSVQIGNSSTAVITPTAIAANGDWSLAYAFDESGFSADPRPGGAYTLTLTARDNALPDGNPKTLVIPFQIDMTPPTVTLLSHKSETQLTDGAVLTGTVSDSQSSVAGVDIAFVSAETALATEIALLALPLDDLPETVLFANTGISQTQVFCLGETCPASGSNGADGTAVTFDGSNDLLRAFGTFDVPESGLTTSLWFNTTCADCGLFSVTQGQFPTVTEHDRDLFLNNGNVCSSVLTTGGVRDLRCSVQTFNDGAWHQVVQTLGANGTDLYVDGDLVVSSPVTASTFTAQDGVLIGYAPAAASPYLNGSLDDITIYAGALAPESVASLYRKWQPVTVNGGEWSFALPTEIEGYTQIDMRAADSLGNRTESRGDWPQFRGPIDTKAPTFDVTATYSGSGSSAQTTYSASVRDENLTTTNFEFVCPEANTQLSYQTGATQQAFTGQSASGQLKGINAQCTVSGFQTTLVAANACDTYGHCAAGIPPQTVAYVGTTDNRVLPYGSLPNAIERVNLSDPANRVRLIERTGRQIADIAVDELHSKLYWAEIAEGPGGQPAGVWRANLDGSNPESLVSGLTAYAAEALQIAIDPVGNRLYWTQGYQLTGANLDGTLPQIVYSIPPDPGFSGGGLDVMGIGDVAIDTANGRLYMSELRQRGDQAGYTSGIRTFPQILKQTLIVSTDLNGQSPEFVAGAGPSCTYADFYDNKGYGTGAGEDPIHCLLSGTDGFDVESMTVSDGTLYWSAIDSNGVSSGVYGKALGQAVFTVASLGLSGNTGGLRVGPLPQLYVNPVSHGVFVQLGTEIVRGETDGEFTRFTSFQNNGATIAPGTTQRSSSTLTAMTILQTAQETQTAADLAVGITSPALVLVDGETARYDIAVRNDAALAADSTVLTLALPDDASYAGSNVTCADGGTTVTCNLGRFAPLSQQTVAISFTIATATVRDLTATASVASATAERTPANNSASHTSITVAPTLAALPGIPYLYYGDNERLTRIGLFGDYTAEPVFMDPNISGNTLASDLVRNRLYIVTYPGPLIGVDPDGGNRVEIANTNPGGIDTQGRNRVAVDETTGRVFWSEINTAYLTTIKSANPDGSDVQTVIGDIRNQRSLIIDPIKHKLLWVGNDLNLRQELIFRSNLDGSDLEVLYTAPEGAQLRDLALDPYAQKLYWVDPTTENEGSLFWSDIDGGRLAELSSYFGPDAHGLVVRPEENALYYYADGTLYRNELNGANEQGLTYPESTPYTGLALPVNPTTFQDTYIMPPAGALAYVIATPFADPPCVVNDSNEPNNDTATATAVGEGSTTGALCVTDRTLPQDIDFYQISVPNNQQLNVTLSNLPDDYNLLAQRAGQTLASSGNNGQADEAITLPNYQGPGDYTIVVYGNGPADNPAAYTLDLSLSAAPPRTSFTDEECLAVDPNDGAGLTGNYAQSQATPLTVGTASTGALCYDNDVDFYSFTANAGQQMRFTLPVRPADYDMHIYRPDGSFYNAFNATTTNPLTTLDTTGTWAVAVSSQAPLTPTTDTYQLLVSDGQCGVNDSWEPNNTANLAAALGTPGRVSATLCDASDSDYYGISASAGQTLTINYPANSAGGILQVLDAAGAEVGRVLPGNRGDFVLTAGGNYTLAAANSSLSGSDVAYMFQWQLDASSIPADATEYIYFGNNPHLGRVALADDHSAEPILIDGGSTGFALAADLTRNKLLSIDTTRTLFSVDFDGRNRSVIVANANPNGVLGTLGEYQNLAVDEVGGRVFWLKPTGDTNSTSADIMRTNLDGSGEITVLPSNRTTSLLVDQVRGELYWVNGTTIYRSDLDGTGLTTVREAAVGQELTFMALDPLARQLYWIDKANGTLMRRSLQDGTEATLISSLGNTSGLVLYPQRNELYYSNDGAIVRAGLDGSNPTVITALGQSYNGPSNLDPNAFVVINVAQPTFNMVAGIGTPLLSPCAVADGYEPNDSVGAATPLTVSTETEVYGALCRSTFGAPRDADYYAVTVASGKVLTVTLSQQPADYTLVVIHPDNYAAAFSNNPGLADETGTVTNISGADLTYAVLVQLGGSAMNTGQYKLTLALGDAPPPPDPGDAACGAVDPYDAPGTGNGTLATATPLTLGSPLAAALCYVDDVDMYAFAALAGQSVSLDLPTRPQDYDLTFYDPAGIATMVISSTTSPAYGDSVTLPSSGLWTVAVSVPNLTPTTDQYQLLVTDQTCLASDANEPNNSTDRATSISDGSRVRATLCGPSDVDLYSFSATSGQQLTLNYPANATGAAAQIVRVADDSTVGQVTAGGQGIFTIPADGDYRIEMGNAGLTGSDVPYQFELLVGTPTTPPSGSPYLYYSRINDLIRTTIDGSTVEPILLPNTFMGGIVLASDTVRGKLYVLDYSERIVQVNPDGSNPVVVVADTSPAILRTAKSLAVDERSGRIFWMQPTTGFLNDILSANSDGSTVQTLVTDIAGEEGLAVDPVGGRLYWAQNTFFNNAVRDVVRRSNLDGTEVETIYAAPVGRQIRELTIDPFAQTLYWRDPSQNRLLQAAADGSESAVTIAEVGEARGFVVRPLLGELYFTNDSQIWKAGLDGSDPVSLARLDGAYNGVSNLDTNAFYPTNITVPGSNLALAYSAPFAQPCTNVDNFEPNNTLATAAAIAPGSFSAALCSPDLVNVDAYDYYTTTVASGKQITATLSDLPQPYTLILLADGVNVGSNYGPGTPDKALTAINRSGSPVVYAVLVARGIGNSSRLPYTLDVAVADAPPPPPPPAPPVDGCATVDTYDQPGVLGNQTRATATDINFNETITAALCYSGDKDAYAFNGVIGQNVIIDLPVRPKDYLVSVYNPAGQYVTGIFPGSSLGYGGSVTLNAAGRWTLIVWDQNLSPTTSQYELLLSVNTACSGLDPYEPNNDQFSPREITTRTLTLDTMLCETNDWDYYSFPLAVGDKININPRVLVNGMRLSYQPPGSGISDLTEPLEMTANIAGNFILGIAPPFSNSTENLPYQVDVQIDAPPPPPPTPNNWSCTVYPSSDVTQSIATLGSAASMVAVTADGAVTHVSLKDISLKHEFLKAVSFGLAAPSGAPVDLFGFDDSGSANYCGYSGVDNCLLSIDDYAVEGLSPPLYPTAGDAYRPTRNSFAPFDGQNSNGTWSLFISDDGSSSEGGRSNPSTDALLGWSLEVCIDNGQTPDPAPTPTATPTPDPQPDDGAIPTASTSPTATATPTPAACTPTADAFESDNTYQSASVFDVAAGSSVGHTFHTPADADWQQVGLLAGLQYTVTAAALSPAQIVRLTLYDTNGSTVLDTQSGKLTFTPTVSGIYYVRAMSGSGLGVSACDSGYSLVLSARNPSATQVSDPVGTALPAGHSAPSLSVTLLLPVDGTVMTEIQLTALAVGLNAVNSIAGAEILVNDTSLATYPASGSDTDLVWQTGWTPPQAGVFGLAAVITDGLGITATSTVRTVYVDLADPTVSIVPQTITAATLASDGSYALYGTATDDSQINKIEVRLDGGAWQEAEFNGGTNWSLAIAPLALANPDGGSLSVEARVTDKAGRTATDSVSVTVDVTPPDSFIVTPTQIGSGAVITPGLVNTELGVRLSWPAVPGADSLYAGWTDLPNPVLGSLTVYGAEAGSHDQTLPEASALYAHVVAVDAVGNQTVVSSGPYYFDGPQTPDLIGDLVQENWVESGGKQVGQMATGDRGVQKLFVGWDADQLRLRWQGVNLGVGDLYLYLGVGGSGTSDLFNPSGPDQPGVLPFAADYLVRLSDGVDPTLFALSGGTWVTQTQVAALSSGDLTDLLLPFGDLGIAGPAVASLKLLGVATTPGSATPWATIPDQNLGRPWNQFIEFASLGAGIVPSAGVWADAQLEVTILVDPSPDQWIGAGDSIQVTVTVQNGGTAPLPSLTVNGTTSGGIALSNAPQVASNIPVSGTASLTLNGTVSGDGTLGLTLADSYHRPYLLETLTYQVDDTPPINVSVAISHANPGINIALGYGEDDSSIGQFDLEVNGVITPCAGAGAGYVCEWDAGNAAEGSSFALRGRATDTHGNVSWSDVVQVQVDATAPTLTLSAAANAALSDGRLNLNELTLTGFLTDNQAPDSAQLCVENVNANCSTFRVQPDDSWTLSAPALGDGVTTTLAFVGYDVAGNASQPSSSTVLVDSVAPKVSVTSINPGTMISPTAALLASGTVTDGGGVASVQIYLVKPDGGSATVPGILDGLDWSVPYYFDQTGEYQALVVARDLAGNPGTLSLGTFTATAMAPIAELTVSVVGNGTVTPTIGTYISGTVVPITATADVGWTFAGWSGDLSGGVNPTAISLDGDKVVTATFTSLSTVQVPLYNGWNLFGYPLDSTQPVTDVLTSIAGSYDAVYGWDAQADGWTTFVPGFLGNNLAGMSPGGGYWVHATADVSVTLTGTVAGGLELPFYTGWNLYGYTWENSQSVTDTLGSIAGSYDGVYGWDGQSDAWTTYVPGFLGNDLGTMGLGEGFWVHTTANVTTTHGGGTARNPTDVAQEVGGGTPPPSTQTGLPPALPGILYGRVQGSAGVLPPGLTVTVGVGEQTCARAPVVWHAGEWRYLLVIVAGETACGQADAVLDIQIGESETVTQAAWQAGMIRRLDLTLPGGEENENGQRIYLPLLFGFSEQLAAQAEEKAAGSAVQIYLPRIGR